MEEGLHYSPPSSEVEADAERALRHASLAQKDKLKMLKALEELDLSANGANIVIDEGEEIHNLRMTGSRKKHSSEEETSPPSLAKRATAILRRSQPKQDQRLTRSSGVDYDKKVMKKKTVFDGDESGNLRLPETVENPVLLASRDAVFMKLDGLSIHCKMTEDRNTVTLVMMHGFCGNVMNFNPVWPQLAQKYQLLAFDRPGWGLSQRVHRREDGTWPTDSGDNPYLYDYSCKLLLSIIEETKKRGLVRSDSTLVLVGHSHGGATAAYALCMYEHIRKMFIGAVLVDAPLRKWPVPRSAAAIAKAAPRFSGVVTGLAASLGKKLAGSNFVLGVPFHNFNEYIQNNPNGAVGWDQTFRVRGWKKAFVEWSLANAEFPVFDLTPLQELPVLDIRGEDDQVIDPKEGFNCAKDTGAKVVMVELSGHVPFAERPERFLEHFNEFISSLHVVKQEDEKKEEEENHAQVMDPETYHLIDL